MNIKNQKLVSIIMNCYNSEKYLKQAIDSVLNQSYNSWELIIWDNKSTDNTSLIANSYDDNRIKYFLAENFSPLGEARNMAIKKSTGEIIIRVDGHSIIHYDYVSKCKQQLNLKNCACVGGLIQPLGNSIFTKIITLATSSKFGVGNSKFHYSKNSCWSDTVYLGAYKREIFEKIGGYDEELVRNQDDEFNFRLIQNGWKIWLDPSIKSSYYPRDSFTKLFKQYFQYGFYKVRVMQKRKGLASWRHVVPGLFALTLLFGLSIFLFTGNTIPILSLCLPYLSFSLFATILESIKTPSNLISVMMLPITFFILHISYGLGFLMGFIYFLPKWGDIIIKDAHFDKEQFTKNSNFL